MQENKMEILCTRPLNEIILQKAALRNISVDVIPFIETKSLEDAETVQKIQSFNHKNIRAIFTSMNAVEAVRTSIKPTVNWKIFSLGGITKELVQQYFGKASIAGTAKHSTALAKKIIDDSNTKEVVFFCGDKHLDILPQTLKANGIFVDEFIVYKTILIPQVIEKNYDGILFFSPSAVHSFFSVNTIGQQVVLFAIGTTTASAIQTYCINKIITSEWPGKEQMIDKAIEYLEKTNAHSNNLNKEL